MLPIQRISEAAMLALTDDEDDDTKAAIFRALRARQDVVLFENLDSTSPWFGRRSFIKAGPGMAYTTATDADGCYLRNGDVQCLQHAIAYCSGDS